jgi:hypothetical protein
VHQPTRIEPAAKSRCRGPHTLRQLRRPASAAILSGEIKRAILKLDDQAALAARVRVYSNGNADVSESSVCLVNSSDLHSRLVQIRFSH